MSRRPKVSITWRDRPSRPARRLRAALLGLLAAALPAAAAQVEIPDTTVGYATALSLPVRVTDLGAEGVVAAEITILFDPTVISLDSLAVGGTAFETWLLDTVLVSGPSLDTLKVAAATAGDTLSSDVVLFYLDIRVADLRHPSSSPFELPQVLLNAGSPAVVATGGSLTIVGADAAIAVSPGSIHPGDTLTLTVDDIDEDRTAGAEVVTLRLTIGTDSETVSAVEGTPGSFQATLSTVFSLGATAEDGILQVPNGGLVSMCYTDLLDAAGSTVERCVTTVVIEGHDGTVEATVVVQPGDSVRVRVTDDDLNIDSGATDSATVTLVNERTGEQETVGLDETGHDTGIFVGMGATAAGAGPGVSDDGVLLATKGDTLLVDFDDESTATGGSALRRWTVVTVEPFGDASGNGNVRGFDASLILDHSVGTLTLAGLDSLSANLDTGAPYSPINAFDASLVLQHRVGLLPTFPVQQQDAANHPQPASAPRPLAETRDVDLVPTADGWVVRVKGAEGITSGELVVRGFHGRALAGAGIGSAMIAARIDGGVMRIAFATALPATGDDLLLLLPGPASQSPVLERADFDGGRLRGRLAGGLRAGAVAARFQLFPVVPNPFNPSTTIAFELDAAVRARLWIVNSLGQTVRVLLDEPMVAGRHAVFWDGRDDQGRPVAAGTYFHRLQTPIRGALGKMTLVK